MVTRFASRTSAGRHIIEEHAELAEMRENVIETIGNAERVVSGSGGELLAVRMIEPAKALVVVYREVGPDDGFVITAFVTRRLKNLERRLQSWPPLT
jgi:hypothetical protein